MCTVRTDSADVLPEADILAGNHYPLETPFQIPLDYPHVHITPPLLPGSWSVVCCWRVPFFEKFQFPRLIVLVSICGQ